MLRMLGCSVRCSGLETRRLRLKLHLLLGLRLGLRSWLSGLPWLLLRMRLRSLHYRLNELLCGLNRLG
jgi:hypothetical protein